jgi:hypothetical protein
MQEVARPALPGQRLGSADWKAEEQRPDMNGGDERSGKTVPARGHKKKRGFRPAFMRRTLTAPVQACALPAPAASLKLAEPPFAVYKFF